MKTDNLNIGYSHRVLYEQLIMKKLKRESERIVGTTRLVNEISLNRSIVINIEDNTPKNKITKLYRYCDIFLPSYISVFIPQDKDCVGAGMMIEKEMEKLRQKE